jgi:hypothetical protein
MSEEKAIIKKIIDSFQNEEVDLAFIFSLLYDLYEFPTFRDLNQGLPQSKIKASKSIFSKTLDALMQFCSDQQWQIPQDYPSMTIQYIEEHQMFHGNIVYEELAFIYMVFPHLKKGLIQGIDLSTSLSKYGRFEV